MTYQQILWAIDQAAELAAQSAIDAHGENPPSAEIAWDFLEQIYESEEIERPAALPQFLTRQFKHDYRRHCRIVLSNLCPDGASAE